ncbi:MAG: hypothetical protein QHJ73_06100 [Armatimonadota bacterium]|jgi:predicted peptidase|nr:hypothetical protein [Armatimonadota bacterium]
MRTILAFLLCASVLATISAPLRAASAPLLAPGTTITVKFPDMPPTYHEMVQRRGTTPQMTVFLPTNYDPNRKYPLLVLLYGGDGGNGANPGVARALTEDKDFVCLSVPLFKVTDPKAPGGNIVMRDEDGRYMWPFFRTMLAKLYEIVPNIDPARQVLGGFSNGAHAVQGMVDQSDGEVARRFSAFLFVEGGGRMQHFELLKGKPYLMLSSNAKSLPRAKEVCEAARAAGAQTTLLFEDIGSHGFPASSYPAIRKWLRDVALR